MDYCPTFFFLCPYPNNLCAVSPEPRMTMALMQNFGNLERECQLQICQTLWAASDDNMLTFAFKLKLLLLMVVQLNLILQVWTLD